MKHFVFCNDDNIAFLEENGMQVMYFSPIHDSEIPHDADGVIFWGDILRDMQKNYQKIRVVKT